MNNLAQSNKIFLVPIVLIVFNRPEKTKVIFDRIVEIQPKNLLIVSDGARKNFIGEELKVNQVREIFENLTWDCNLQTNYSNENLGPKKRISSGINWAFSLFDEIIILEDDCLPSKSFFLFCEEMLNYYRNDNRIGMIGGYNYWSSKFRLKSSYAFSKYPMMWGYATWKNRWLSYDYDIKLWPIARDSELLKNLFSRKIERNYWQEIFELNYSNEMQHYDYCWALCSWLESRLCIYPSVNLISNIGFDMEASNTKDAKDNLANFPLQDINFPLTHPKIIAPDFNVEQEIFKTLYNITFITRLKMYLKLVPFLKMTLRYLKFFIKKNKNS